jgi:monoamine oxidase
MPQDNHADVIVVGAGVSGLTAAQRLCSAGLCVICLEARNRIGGRIWTVHDPSFPAPIELGAEFIHGRPPETWSRVRQANIATYEIAGDTWCVENRKLLRCSEVMSRVDEVFEKLEARRKRAHPRSDETFTDFIEHECRDCSESSKQYALHYVEGFNAARADRISVESLLVDLAAEKKIDGERAFKFKAGYDSLLPTVHPQSPNFHLRLETVVEEIRWGGAKVEIVADNASSGATQRELFAADRAVITLPLSVLQQSLQGIAPHFVPLLEAKRSALGLLEDGPVIRVTLHLRRRFWAEDALCGSAPGELKNLNFLFTDDEHFPTWWTRSPEPSAVLTGWSAGRAVDSTSRLSKEETIDRAIGALSRALCLSPEKMRRDVLGGYTHDWQADPFSRGAYSYSLVGGADASRQLAEPLGCLFFAGEATEFTGHHATVHGAIATGERAAQQVLATLRPSP